MNEPEVTVYEVMRMLAEQLITLERHAEWSVLDYFNVLLEDHPKDSNEFSLTRVFVEAFTDATEARQNARALRTIIIENYTPEEIAYLSNLREDTE